MNTKLQTNPGDVVEIFEQRKLLTAICLGYKNNRLVLLTESSKMMTLSDSRIIHTSRERLNPAESRKELITRLRNISSDRDLAANSLDMENLWKHFDCKGQVISPAQLHSAIASSNHIHPTDYEAGFLRAVHNDKLYFKNSNKSVYINTEEEVAKNKARLEEELIEQQFIDGLVQWINKSLHSTQTPDVLPEGYDRLIETLKADATQKPIDQKDKNLLTSVMKQLTSNTKMSSFDLLVHLGEFDLDENLDIIRFQYPTAFMKEALFEVEKLQQQSLADFPKRQDLTHLECFTIDNHHTKDFDDALSFRRKNNHYYEIGIHIADVAYWVSSGSYLDQEALERGQTLYLPPKTWHMFPALFSESIASLTKEQNKPALSVLVTLNTDASIHSFEVIPSVINISKQFTYNDVDTNIESDPFADLLQIARLLLKKRMSSGAIIMPRPEINIDATNTEQIVIRRRNRQTHSQLIVAELMILTNSIISGLAAQSDLPFPYRCQEKPAETAPRSDDEFNPYIAWCQRKIMPRADYSLKPKPHFTLGLQSYTNITSPIRRYFDVLAQRQLKAILGIEKPYSHNELESLMTDLEASVARASAISHNQHNYWLLKYLEGFQGQTIDAMVMDRISNGYQVFLMQLCMDAFLPLSFGHKLYPEQVVKVILERVSPRDNSLKLRLK